MPDHLESILLRAVRAAVGPLPIQLRVGEAEEQHIPELHLAEISIADWRTALKLLVNTEIEFGDAYSDERLRVTGDLISVLRLLYEAPALGSFWASLAAAVQKVVHGHSVGRARKNARRHYSLQTDFYRVWLDRALVYTCAYFGEPGMSLDAAQQAKLDLVCRKVWLQSGESVVEAGCGWGALALHMASHYGVRVKAFNVCEEQLEIARESAKRLGLERQVEFIHDDYRNIRGKFDAFVSVGMLEHVGKSHYAELAQVISRTIGNTGRGLLHFIGRSMKANMSPWIQKNIFPGGYVPTLSEVLPHLEPAEFAVIDVENLRFHYARTLEEWLSRYQANFDSIASRFGSSFARMWRLYLAGSAAAFHVGTLQLFQIAFAGAKCDEIPWTRAHLYRDERETGSQQWKTAM